MSASVLEWSFHPWRDRPLAAAAAALIALGTCLGVLALDEPLLFRLGLCLMLLGSLSPLLAPAWCRVDDEGVAKRGPFGTVRRRWSELRRGVVRPAGLLVSPYARPHWLDSYRGLLLPLPARGRDALLADVAARLHAHGL